MKYYFLIFLLLFFGPLTQAGVYGDLEFGDDRETVARKLSKSALVSQTVDNTFIGRTGLNGIFKCKAKLSGLTCHLYFNWNERGGLNEITLRTDSLSIDDYDKKLLRAWNETGQLFTQVYGAPAQKSSYPHVNSFKQHKMLVSHVWGGGGGPSILMGPGINKGKCFLFIRFVEQQVSLEKNF